MIRFKAESFPLSWPSDAVESALRILIVDDEPARMDRFHRALADHPVLFAFDAESALRLTELEGPFAVTITAHELADSSGEELLERLSALSPETTLLLVAEGLGITDAIRVVNELGVSCLLTADADDDDLRRAVDRAVARYQATVVTRRVGEDHLTAVVEDLWTQIHDDDVWIAERVLDLVDGWLRLVSSPVDWEIVATAFLSPLTQMRSDGSVVDLRAEDLTTVTEASRDGLTVRTLVGSSPRLDRVTAAIDQVRRHGLARLDRREICSYPSQLVSAMTEIAIEEFGVSLRGPEDTGRFDLPLERITMEPDLLGLLQELYYSGQLDSSEDQVRCWRIRSTLPAGSRLVEVGAANLAATP
jgi:ActR/RegA family two-component response regulator